MFLVGNLLDFAIFYKPLSNLKLTLTFCNKSIERVSSKFNSLIEKFPQ